MHLIAKAVKEINGIKKYGLFQTHIEDLPLNCGILGKTWKPRLQEGTQPSWLLPPKNPFCALHLQVLTRHLSDFTNFHLKCEDMR